MLSRLCMKGVWKVQVRCLEVRWNVSCGPLLVGVWRDSEGCLDSVWRASEMCLEGVWKVSGSPGLARLAPFDPGRY